MKVLYHHRIRSKDGQSVHVEEIIGAFKRLGHHVEVCAPVSFDEEEFGGESKSLSMLKQYLPRFFYELLEFSYAFLDSFKLAMAVKRVEPDFIYERYNLFLPSGIWVKKIQKIPLLLEVNAPLFEERMRFGGISIKWLARWTERYSWANADHVFPVSNVLAEHVRRIGVPGERISVTHNGVNLDQFGHSVSKNDAKRALGLEGKLVLGFVGFIRDWHGLDKVIDVMADNKDVDCIFCVIGDGPGREKLELQARRQGVLDQVIFTGLVERDDIHQYISAFDIALQPDVVAYASPLKLFEYMACACSIIAPDTDNIKEVLTHNENALLFRAGNKAEFTRAILKLICDEVVMQTIGENARQAVFSTPHTWQHNASSVIEVAKRIINSE